MKKPEGKPWQPADYDEPVVMAIKALAAGNANEGQQQRALKWLIEDCCKAYDLSFRPDSERDTAFAEGKRYVALQIVKLMKLPVTVFSNPTRENDRSRRR